MNCPCITGVFFILLVFVPGFVLFWIGLADHKRAESHHPTMKFSIPSDTLMALHWLFVISSLFLGIVLIFFEQEDESTTDGPAAICHSPWTIGVCVAALIAFYIAYLVIYFRSPEFTASDTSWSLSDYQARIATLRDAQPQLVLSGTATNFIERCHTSDVTLTAQSSVDASEFPDLATELENTEAVLFRPKISIEWDADANDKIGRAKDQINDCLWRLVMHVAIDTRSTTVGWIGGAFVSKTGKMPKQIARGRAIAAGILWSGIYHAFEVGTIPELTGSVIKKEASLPDVKLNCWDVLWYCS
jgi:hypothetical protein